MADDSMMQDYQSAQAAFQTVKQFGTDVKGMGQTLTSVHEELQSSLSEDDTGFGAMITGALSDVCGVAGKVFTEGGRVLSEMGSRGSTNTDRNQNTDQTIGDAFTSIHDEHYGGDGPGGSGSGPDSGPRDGSSGSGSDAGSLSSKTQAEQSEDAHLDGEGGSGGDPVDVVSGEMFLVQQDLVLPGVLPLALERRFASGYRRGRCFGARWSSTLDQRIEIDEEGIHFAAVDGRVLHYPVPAVHGQQVMPSFGPRWPLVWERGEGRDEVRIEQGDLGRTLTFLPGPTPQVCRPLSAVVDRGGNRYTFAYDVEGVPTDIYHSGGYHLRMASVPTRGGARISTITLADPGGGADLPVREFGYDRAGSLIEIRHPDSPAPLVFEYDQDDRITAWTDRNGHWYRYTYRQDGRVAAGVGEDGFLSASFEYDLQARTTTTSDALGHVRVFHWNGLGQSMKMLDPLGGELRTEQNRDGQVLANTDQLGRTTRIARNASGDPVRIANADGSNTLIDYDERRLPTRAAHSDGRVWSYEHGAHGKVTAITNPLGAVMRFEHDEHGRLVRSTDPLGAATVYRCDAAGLPLEVTDALGAVTVIRRDAFGRIVETVDAAGASTHYDWSPGGRLVRTRYPDGAAEQWEYDPEGNVLSITGPTGASTTFTYGPFDKPTSRTDPGGAVHRFAYDAALRLTTVTGPTGLSWEYEYDDAGHLIAERDFNDVRIDYRLDPAGQLIERTSPAGAVQFTRDAAGRLIERRVNGRTTRFTYGVAGRLQSAETAQSTLAYTLDALGQILTEGTDGHAVTNVYDQAGRRVQRVTPSGVVTRWSYDAVGQHTAMAGTHGSLTFGYDQLGRETSRLLGPGALAYRTYDPSGRLATEGVWAYPHQDAATASPSSEPAQIQARIYSYLPDGAPEQIQDALRGTRRFELDAAGRITRVRAASWQASYVYDALGNLAEALDPAAREDTAGARQTHGTRIQRAGRTTYEYDQAGRLTQRTRRTLSGQSRTWTFSWDPEGNLHQATLPDGDTWTYTYDPLGRRTGKTHHRADGTALQTVRFDWDGPRLAEESTTDPAGRTSVRTWDYQPAGFTPLAQTRRSWAENASQAEIDAEFHAIVTDLVGTPTELVTPDGELSWYTTTSVWGQSVTAPGSTTQCPLRFPGQYHDTETGLDYNLHRYYDPDLAAYLSPDPLGLAPSPNNTAYPGNPLIEYDPLGLFSCPVQVQQELAQFRQDTNMKSIAQEDADIAAQVARGVKNPRGANTVGKMEFDGGRDPVYGVNGQLTDRSNAYPGPGNRITQTSFQDHAEGDMVYQASQNGYSGGNAAIYTDRPTCQWCRNSMRGYAQMLNLDSITVYGPNGLVGVWDQTGKIG